MTSNLSNILPDIDDLEEEFSMLDDFEEISTTETQNTEENKEEIKLELVESERSIAKKSPLETKIDYILKDFNFIRSEVHDLTNQSKSLMKLVMDQIEEEDGRVNGTTLLAFSQMNTSIGNNLRLLISMYEKIIKIQKDYKKINEEEKNIEQPKQINNGTINNIYASNSSDLLKTLSQLEKKEG